ncbi:MAG TPA: ubiquinone/menaquinone biosynthesis methyltransferase [Vicinamibacterales bacterium]|nr:ubiquinone/menaquinone biosynthesis methyltransferase [Vicinamibacterales bacterium]
MSASPSKPELARAFDAPDVKRRYNRRMFGTIAPRYDLITRLLSFGGDQRWKARAIDMAGIAPGHDVLDLACGTGDLAIAAAAKGATVVGLDLTMPMIELARARPAGPADRPPAWLVGDMHALPVPSGRFDVVTTGYGLRNVPDLPVAIAEIHRVLRPGGIFCSLDFNKPEAAWLRSVYLTYLDAVGGTLGWVLHRDPDTYRYIPASIRRYPGARGVVDLLTAAGFHEARYVPVLGGLMAIHLARR